MRFDQISIEQMGRLRDMPQAWQNGMLVIVTAVGRETITAKVVQARPPAKVGDFIYFQPFNFDPNIL